MREMDPEELRDTEKGAENQDAECDGKKEIGKEREMMGFIQSLV